MKKTLSAFSNVVWDHKHVEVSELNEVILAAASSVHRLRSFQYVCVLFGFQKSTAQNVTLTSYCRR